MRKDLSLVKRALLSLFALVAIVMGAKAQYVFVTANPSGSGEVRVAKSIADLGAYQNGSDLIFDAEPGETIYFDFRPYSGYQFTGTITNDANLTDITPLDNGIYSFTMPEYEGMFLLNISIQFEQETVIVEGVNINEENFPDANFRKWLLAQSYGKDAVITDAEMAGITKISATGCGIADLTGIEYFTQLTELNVANFDDTPEEKKNRITSIDLSALTKLRKLWCNDNLIASLDFSQCPDLRDLDCSNNQLTELNVTGCPYLSTLLCSGNNLTELDVTQNPSMYQLYCDNNQLTSIDVTNFEQMIMFNCYNNQLTSLDLTGCTALFQLYCYNNKIKGEAMTNLVNSLETPPNGGYMVIIDLESDTEENEMTEELAAVAKEKGWSVEAWLGDDSVPYPYDPNVHHYVDLGLPSGTLWATTNIGAVQPYQSGLFFAWGDTEGHGSDPSDGYLFSWENYKWGEVSGYDTYFTKYCSDSSRGKDGFTDGKAELDLEDDAAYVNWGPQWRMPSKEQFDELRSECTWTRMYLGDVYGYDVEGPNGNSIFLPDTGYRIDDMFLEGGGAFWTRTAEPNDVAGAFYLGWYDYEWEHYDWYEFGARADGQCVRPVVNRLIELAANEDNSEVINNAANDGGAYDVKLCDRTLYKDGTWNTLCLPFSLNEDQIETMLESPQQIKTLSSTDFDPETGTLTLNFEEATTIGAGMAYIIRWEPSENPDNSDYSDYSESSELRNPIFSGVTLSDTYTSYVTEYAEFIGTTSPVTLTAGDRTVLYLGANNTLYSPSVDKVIKSCYAYFKLMGGITAGDKANQVRAFRLNFGDGEATAIGTLADNPSKKDNTDWYSADGRRMNGKPTTNGLYINKGQKLFIK